MRVRIVRTPGELRDEIGHRIMVRKDWEGTVVKTLDEAELIAAGFHPKRTESVYLVQFDDWAQPIAVPGVNLVVLAEPGHDAG